MNSLTLVKSTQVRIPSGTSFLLGGVTSIFSNEHRSRRPFTFGCGFHQTLFDGFLSPLFQVLSLAGTPIGSFTVDRFTPFLHLEHMRFRILERRGNFIRTGGEHASVLLTDRLNQSNLFRCEVVSYDDVIYGTLFGFFVCPSGPFQISFHQFLCDVTLMVTVSWGNCWTFF